MLTYNIRKGVINLKKFLNIILIVILTAIFFYVYLQILSFILSSLYVDLPILEVLLIIGVFVLAFLTSSLLLKKSMD